ncbi:MAG TPA: histidine kinase, partial [Cystobacter sp.]
DQALAFQVRLAQARTELVSGSPSEAQRQLEELRPRTRTRADMVAVYILTQDIHFATGEFLEGMNSMLECLSLLGMPVSPHPTWEEAVAAHEEVWALLGPRSIQSLLELPLMTDPDMKMAVLAHYRLFPVAYNTDPHLLIILLSRVVSLTLRHGVVDDAVGGYAWFGVITSAFFKRHREGLAFARLALGVVERHHFSVDRGSVFLGVQLNSYWVQPLPHAQEIALNGLHHALQAGDVAAACYCSVSLFSNRLAMGHSLDEVHQESLVRGEYLRKTGSVDFQDWLLLGQRYVQQLRGHSLSFSTLSGEGFDERAYEARLTPGRTLSTQSTYWVYKMQSRFMCGAYQEACEAADQMIRVLWAPCGTLHAREGHFYRALTLAACFEGASPEQQREWLEAIERHHQQLAQWAENCPENFRALERLVSAERARLGGRTEEATQAYDEAIRAARENGATHYAGLASELAANFWRTRKAPLVAHFFAREARAAYQQWGARAKVQHLESLWPELASTQSPQDAL